jgi:hypothetical protein
MQHGLQPEKKHGHWKTAVHTTQHAWACPFGFLFFSFFLLSFFWTFPFLYIQPDRQRERDEQGAA